MWWLYKLINVCCLGNISSRLFCVLNDCIWEGSSDLNTHCIACKVSICHMVMAFTSFSLVSESLQKRYVFYVKYSLIMSCRITTFGILASWKINISVRRSSPDLNVIPWISDQGQDFCRQVGLYLMYGIIIKYTFLDWQISSYLDIIIWSLVKVNFS